MQVHIYSMQQRTWYICKRDMYIIYNNVSFVPSFTFMYCMYVCMYVQSNNKVKYILIYM